MVTIFNSDSTINKGALVASETSENVAVGEIIGYGRVYNPFSKKARVIVKANDRVIRVPVDYRQQRYIQNEHRIGDRVAVGFYGGEWHIGSSPTASNDCGPEQDISDLDLLQYELNSLDLLNLVGRPFSVPDAEPLQVDNAFEGEEIEKLKEKAVINLLLSEIDEHRDYLKEIEQDIRKNSDLILEDLGLSHLKKYNQNKKLKQIMAGEEIKTIDKINLDQNRRLDLIIIQNNQIISMLDEVIYLLKETMAR